MLGLQHYIHVHIYSHVHVASVSCAHNYYAHVHYTKFGLVCDDFVPTTYGVHTVKAVRCVLVCAFLGLTHPFIKQCGFYSCE